LRKRTGIAGLARSGDLIVGWGSWRGIPASSSSVHTQQLFSIPRHSSGQPLRLPVGRCGVGRKESVAPSALRNSCGRFNPALTCWANMWRASGAKSKQGGVEYGAVAGRWNSTFWEDLPLLRPVNRDQSAGDALADIGGQGCGAPGLEVYADTRQKRARGNFTGFLV
jgi:hypothetical protein